jgi:hypothetical protein
MSYWQRWEGSTDPADKSGTAHFVVDGLKYSPKLPEFSDCAIIDDLLDAAFKQGKQFAADAMSGHVLRAIDRARDEHGLG